MDIQQLTQNLEAELASLNAQNKELFSQKFLSRKEGLLSIAFKELRTLPENERRVAGPALSSLRERAEHALGELENQVTEEVVDLTLPGISFAAGTLHPLTQTQYELEDIFKSLGFVSYIGPEVETDYYNFTALNIPENHPARDMWDTFYVKGQGPKGEKLVLRTHTSPMQIRFMETHKPPYSVLFPGTVYRHEATDATHEHTFQQMEGLVVGKNISFANMVWTFEKVLKKYFGEQTKIKLLPSFFPFTEPSCEVAISHPEFRGGKWLEILGCGMVHQNVFVNAGYKRDEYTGFAFGFGLTRFAAMKHKVPDIRLFAENKISFLKQF